jgi:hypothetical protein
MMKSWLLLGLLLMGTVGQADILADKQAAKQLAASVMNTLATGKTAEALDLVKPYLIIPVTEFEAMKDKLAMQAPVIEQRFGKTIGVELVAVEEVGESLMLVMYIQKFEKHVMRWKFYFYQPEDGWVLNTFNTNDKIQMMFSRQ